MELKRECRTAECRWQKTKLTVHHNILAEKLKIYNNAITKSQQFSHLINTNIHNSIILFSTINSLYHPTTNYNIKLLGSKCEELAGYFRDKITNIRSGICQQNMHTAHFYRHPVYNGM